jgi:hypothetical protein
MISDESKVGMDWEIGGSGTHSIESLNGYHVYSKYKPINTLKNNKKDIYYGYWTA